MVRGTARWGDEDGTGMDFLPHDSAGTATANGPAIEWEEVACPLCGGRNGSLLVEAPDTAPGSSGRWFAVEQCQDCGLCYTNPRPSAASIGPFYPPQYAPHRPPRLCRNRSGRPKWFRAWRRADEPRRFLPVQGLGRLLDFGCGGGSFLERMQQQGWHVTGLDTSAAAVDSVRRQLHVPALVGTLPHPELRAESFDVVTMWHALEHVHAPGAVLREAYRLLVPGGKLVVAVPNIDSLPFRLFGPAWFGLDLPRHLTHFTPVTLHFMLERVGFRVGPIRMVRHSQWLRASARLACQSRRGPYWYRWLKAKPVSRLVTWYGSLTEQSDCMLVTAER